MIDVRKAVLAAQNYFGSLQDLMRSPNVGGQIEDVRLEEVELSEDKKFWFITLGFDVLKPASQNTLLSEMMPNREERNYRVFKINAETGEVESMKIRQV
ncbi:hypothetical protein [Phormidium sp. CCY1219]|jgi:hypothetical protein|uniref:hypothetical protein n=1 Tax=Phormidium sp. CCY1219 TaxID=2886104 RepID=UPI002D1F0DAA|nr:hypothetical protein [Phormidium sp. CCY1219]MEB3830519.1 hypothetical protein [Phormidium sp. CCY1219]